MLEKNQKRKYEIQYLTGDRGHQTGAARYPKGRKYKAMYAPLYPSPTG